MDFDSIFRVSPENFDSQVSLDPSEERLNLPPVIVNVGDYKRPKFKVVGYKGDNLVLFSVIELYKAQVFGILAARMNDLDSSFGVLAQSPFSQFDAERDCCRVNCKDLPSGKIYIMNFSLGVHRPNLADEPHTKFFEDSVISGLICLG